MPVLIPWAMPAMRLTVAVIAFAAILPIANADPAKPVRVIEITKENAERSAAAISAARSPLIGQPPPGRTMRPMTDWRNARAQSLKNEADVAQQNDQAKVVRLDEHLADVSHRALVQIIKPGKMRTVVETYIVPRHNAR